MASSNIPVGGSKKLAKNVAFKTQDTECFTQPADRGPRVVVF